MKLTRQVVEPAFTSCPIGLLLPFAPSACRSGAWHF
jgi:hypothetical protein